MSHNLSLELEQAIPPDLAREPCMGSRVARLVNQPTLVFEYPYKHLYDHTCVYLYIAFALFEDFRETK